MDASIGMRRHKTRIFSSVYYTPVEGYRHMFYCVLGVGHARVAPGHPIRNWSRPGHDLILSVAGTGTVHIGERVISVPAGHFVWVDCEHNDTAWPPRPQPWEFFWIRIDSALLGSLAEALEVERDPVFVPRKPAQLIAVFRTIFKLLRQRPVHIDAALHAQIASLITLLFEARQTAAPQKTAAARDMQATPGIAAALNAMRTEYRRQWKIGDLARVSGMSTSLFYARFHQVTGSSPMLWLRRERINQAKRRLDETQERVHRIAAQVGYGDALYFTRLFKKLVGVSPRQYRQQGRQVP